MSKQRQSRLQTYIEQRVLKSRLINAFIIKLEIAYIEFRVHEITNLADTPSVVDRHINNVRTVLEKCKNLKELKLTMDLIKRNNESRCNITIE